MKQPLQVFMGMVSYLSKCVPNMVSKAVSLAEKEGY